MGTNFHERLAAAPVEPPSDRSTGLVFTAVGLLVALAWRKEPAVLLPALVVSALLALVSVAAPSLLRPLNILWFKFGLVLHRVVNPLVMFALFALVFVPAGWLMRLWHDPLRLKRKPDADTYWINRAERGHGPQSMTNQF